jgi:hypothetical protein
MTVIERQGKPLRLPDNSPSDCDDCTYTEAEAEMKGEDGKTAYFSEESDAITAYGLKIGTGDSVRDQLIKEAWKKAFNHFKCVATKCSSRAACGDDLVWMKAETTWLATSDKQGKGVKKKYTVVVMIGRKIKCVAETAAGGPDSAPEIPKFERYEEKPKK